MDKRGGYHDFQSKLFSLTVPKNIVGNPSVVLKFGVRKNFMHNRGSSQHNRRSSRFSVGFLVSQYRKILWGNRFVFHNFVVRKKVLDERGVGYYVFPSNILCLIVSKNFLGDPSLFDKSSGIERFFARRGW